MFESTDQDLAIALKEMREQERVQDRTKFAKHAKEVPTLNLEKVQEIIRLKCEEDNYSEEEEEEEHEQEGERFFSERNGYDDTTSEEEVPDPKQNIRALLGGLNLKSKPQVKEEEKEKKPALFDYEDK